MIRTTNWDGHILLIDPFSIDMVVYGKKNQVTVKTDVTLYVQGQTVSMDSRVFEADVLPSIEEESKYGTLND
ncbi:hypothetical protein SBP1_gp105 [Vibrio virus vB_VspP_SBP1]|uniref:Uncharacterized protein n=1 Tax=Vibrio virus vB_VspP_SBP1 TaxID=2500581 RepID=A0A3T0IIP0_9CAUD|nr:hypothetical protein KNU36_gp024 [Vibrio virus vB_VspP_SBP1]AZU99697.1 hypothetical protein SBP1_gp105 [Vibrio virus vB_VspP_SBP1]